MIEKTVLDYLTAALPVPVCMEVPPDPPAAFVLLEKTGSGRVNRVDSAVLAVQSYGPTLAQAAALNEAVKAAMEDLDTLEEIAGVRLNTDYNFPDTTFRRRRYQAVFEITHY